MARNLAESAFKSTAIGVSTTFLFALDDGCNLAVDAGIGAFAALCSFISFALVGASRGKA